MPHRPLRARIHLAAIRHNYRLAKQSAPGAKALAVIKANAYGHGAVAVARALAPEADGFAVSCLEEALELRDSGIDAPILLLEGIFAPDELMLAARLDLAVVIHSRAQLAWVLDARPERPLGCWIKLDTGMHRLGFAPEEFPEVMASLAACPHVQLQAVMTHFARADEPEHPYTGKQIAAFERALAGIRIARSLANSAALLSEPRAHGDWTRPGIMLYGASPFADPTRPLPGGLQLRPAMTLESALIAIKELAPGEPVGYGGRFVCARPTRLGIAAVGYADGYPRHAPDGTPVAVAGQLTRLIGRVSMDLLTLDLTDIAARLGDRVELWGEQVSVGAVAAASGTIAYELLSGIGRRVTLIHE